MSLDAELAQIIKAAVESDALDRTSVLERLIARAGRDLVPHLQRAVVAADETSFETLQTALYRLLFGSSDERQPKWLPDVIRSWAQSRHPALRRLAAHALTAMPSPRHGRLILRLARDRNARVRRVARVSLVDDGQYLFGRREHRRFLEKYAFDRDLEVRQNAAWELGHIGERHPRFAIPLLVRMITASNSGAGKSNPRWAAAQSLERIGDRHPRPVLHELRGLVIHPNGDVRAAVAVCVLEHLLKEHWDLCRPVVEEWLSGPDRRPKLCLLLCWLPRRIERGILRRLANDPDTRVRGWAAPRLERSRALGPGRKRRA